MASARVFLLFGLLVFALESYVEGNSAAVMGGGGSRKCKFPAIFNFGDSNSDTGGRSAAIAEVPPPNGETFFGEGSGRFCDGRLIIDFIAEKVGLPYLSAYLDSLGTSFKHGANFATGGSSIRVGGYSPFHLDIQISQFIRFKSRTIDLYKHNSGRRRVEDNLPKPEDFSKALYTMDIGQNDLAYGFQFNPAGRVRASIPDILKLLSRAIHQLYKEGARYFWVHNTGPIGCLPYNVIYAHPKKSSTFDSNGCVKSQNKVAKEFNKQLKSMIAHLKAELPNTAFTYVDLYSAKYALISNAKNQGFDDPLKFCCGSYYGYHIDCGKKETVNGTVYGNPCGDPSKLISWDGIHYSQAANILVANRILNGSLSDPPFPLAEACRNPKNR